MLTVAGARLLGQAGSPAGVLAAAQNSATQIVTVPVHVTSMTVDSYGAQVLIQSGKVSHVEVTETIMWNGGPSTPAPAVTRTVADGHLTLAAPECAAAGPMSRGCEVSFDITTPAAVSAEVSSGGGAIIVSGITGANLDSAGGFVTTTRIAGPLTVSSGGGFVHLDALAGKLNADTGGGPLVAQDLSGPSAAITTGGGPAIVSYSTPPDSVTIRTNGGPGRLGVPGGPYALTADSLGGPEAIEIPVAATATRSITISTGGGPLNVTSPRGIAGFPPGSLKPPPQVGQSVGVTIGAPFPGLAPAIRITRRLG